ncbi:CHAT domain-containing protein [Lentzea tibetensis]|uniref:CHAT domain-containing protein n=1 Tax=Lentzea tibetensis TaxID=2591470 RepID=A0A563EKD5_9PSEU|nr:CHAT domain-containing protein [Lentzea tibetensis]TWP47501.1 CHAT domain-containing protein [Lentzea tibetensis]
MSASEALALVGTSPRLALARADAAAVSSPDEASAAHRAASLALRELGDLASAQRRGRLAVRVASAGSVAEAEARMSLAFVLLERGQVAAALRSADAAAVGLRGAQAARLQSQRALILQRAGRLDEALSAFGVAVRALRRSGDALWEARALNNRGLLHAYRGSLSLASADLERARSLHLGLGYGKFAADVSWNLGFVAARRGDAPAALSLFGSAEAELRAHGAVHPALLVDHAEVLLSVGLVGEARELVSRAVADMRASGARADLAEGQVLLARVALASSDFALAQASAQAARASFRRQGRQGWALHARFLGLRASSESVLASGLGGSEGGRTTRAIYQRAVGCAEELARAGWRSTELDARLTAANAALISGRVGAAREQLRLAAGARRAASAGLRVRAWHAEALLRSVDGDRRGALAALRAGLSVVDQRQAALGATEFRVHVAAHGRRLAAMGLEMALDGGDPRAVLAWAERFRARSLRLPPAQPPDEPELALGLADVRRLSLELQDALLAGRSVVRTRRELRAAEARVLKASRSARSTLHRPVTRPPSVAELGVALGAGALVEYVDHAGSLLAVTVSSGRCRLHRLGSVAEVAERVEAAHFGLRRLAAGFGDLARMREVVRETGAALDALLITPLGLDGPLVVVPTGVLHPAPWGLLPSLRGRAVRVAPSAAGWLHARSRDARGGGVVLVAGPGLPGAAAEVDALGDAYPGGVVLTGEQATGKAVLHAVDGAGIAHIAAHGDLRTDNPLFSSLRLADGPLTVYDLERLARPPELVVLSACQSGRTAVRAGDELMGLSSALLALGTRTVIAAVTPVPDAETARFVGDLHAHLRAGSSPAEALAEAAEPRFICLGA